jgi:hypothetical protein
MEYPYMAQNFDERAYDYTGAWAAAAAAAMCPGSLPLQDV